MVGRIFKPRRERAQPASAKAPEARMAAPTEPPPIDGELEWHKVADDGDLPEGRVKSVSAGRKTVALSRVDGRYWAIDNRCPHQGGPLGEGSIEKGWLRCPWHGWDFCPKTGKPPGGFDDGVPAYPVEERADGIYVGIPKARPHTRTVSDVMVETMVNWGVTHVFGMVGHSNLGLADAFRLQEEAGKLTFIGIRHEGAASFAASGYGKLSGKPAACFSIAGPGATNLITGLWDAKMDRVPILALTGQVDTQVLGPGAFQEIDLAKAFAPVTAYSQTVLHTSRFAELMTLALKHAIVRRDVAHLIFPDEVQTLPAETAKASGPKGRIGAVEIRPPDEALEEAIALLDGARRPIIVAGYGARASMGEIIALAEILGAPVVTTFKGKGQIRDDHPLAGGVLGRSGTPVASWMMNECDLILVFGASFANHTGIDPKKPIIQVDFEQMALGKFHPVTVPVWGEIGLTARLMRGALDTARTRVDQRTELAERWALWRAEKRSREADDLGQGLNAAMTFAALSRTAPTNAVIAVDVGNNAYSFGRYFECRAHRILMSGYLGSIGFAFPAAMGAWAAVSAGAAPGGRDRKVIAVAGDGGFGQYMGELTTAVKYDMPITIVLLNNSELGKISKEQRAGEWPVWQTSLVNPDFAKYAELCGARGFRVTDRAMLEPTLKEALAHRGPSLVDVVQDATLV